MDYFMPLGPKLEVYRGKPTTSVGQWSSAGMFSNLEDRFQLHLA